MAETTYIGWRVQVLSGALAFVVALCSSTAIPHAREQRALLIGVGTYKNIRSLAGPPHDIARMETFLTAGLGFRKDEIAILQDSKATRRAILNTSEQWLVNSTRPGDRIVIYYSGHGSQIPDQDDDEADGLDETLSPFDTGRNGDNQITDDEFARLLDRLEGRDVTVIIDSCHSGTIARGDIGSSAEGEVDTVRTFVPELPTTRGSFDRSAHRKEESFVKAGGSRRVWSAAASNQFSWDSANGGIFTKLFVEGAYENRADENHNGMVANAELLAYLRKETDAYCKANPHCRSLGFTPNLEAEEDEFFDFFMEEALESSTAAAIEPTDVLVQDNEAQVAINLMPGDTLRLGQEMRVEVTSQRHGWLVLLDVNARNEVTQLIPNEIMDSHGRSREIFPGKPMVIPDAYYGIAFAASEPTGEGTLLAIVTEDPVEIEDILDANKMMTVVANEQSYLGGIANRLMAVWKKEGGANRALKWSLGVKKYAIAP